MRQRRLLEYGVFGIAAISFILFVGWWRVDGPGAPEPSDRHPLDFPAMEFRLTDHAGNAVGPEVLTGRATMVFFGFTFCPDVCPTTLSDISSWLEMMGEDSDQLNVIFITVDPERDTVDAMAEYVGYFDANIRGWTGTNEQIAVAADMFRVTYEKVPTDGEDYTMNHTASVFLFKADGQFSGAIDYHETRETAVPKIRRAMTEKEEVPQ
ncbi:SCO family protein [Labrenzia sp. R4_2]|uniref:SCO family protein n=1 Tax=Labrenzia sp. R4_2 TaxID=2821107 RepID=UPI001ADA236E|nr:SCO family protein [Labrenzia sp. R4_2]MBO9422839.1 SCO family protein [Labrenzia sp. R4_2]